MIHDRVRIKSGEWRFRGCFGSRVARLEAVHSVLIYIQ